MGGTFLWPTDEPWPECPHHQIPLVTVLQLRADDFPEMPFRPGADLFQMLWCPREHWDISECEELPFPMGWADPMFIWRKRASITNPRRHNPFPKDPYFEYVPFACRLLPERLIEYPSVYDLPEELVEKIYKWEDQHLGKDGMHLWEYHSDLSVCPGTKIGGYLHWIQDPWIPWCDCNKPMDHLLTIESVEWNGLICHRFTPIEELKILSEFPKEWEDWSAAQNQFQSALWNPTGLLLGDAGNMKLFVCRECANWPIVPTIECS